LVDAIGTLAPRGTRHACGVVRLGLVLVLHEVVSGETTGILPVWSRASRKKGGQTQQNSKGDLLGRGSKGGCRRNRKKTAGCVSAGRDRR
jgi:hypothetical protein